MKIRVDRNVVEFTPDGPRETQEMELLWRVIVDCMRENKKLVPIGEYIPQKENLARFTIEGIPGGVTQWSDEKTTADCAYYCMTCNKYINLKKGNDIPLCCGKLMEPMD